MVHYREQLYLTTAKPTVRLASAAIALAVLVGHAPVGSANAQSSPQPATDTGVRSPVAILFLCRDGATESILAAAYFRRLAIDRGLAVRVEAAGMEPRARVAPSVVQHLKKNGYASAIDKPRQATARDVEAADVIVSIGADVSLLRPRGALKEWREVPDLNVTFDRAVEAIRERVSALVDEMSRSHDQGQ
jgi:arsenate reductase (thioredoxin)